MKFDKELLLKHKFWILLGVFTLIWLIGLTMLMMGSASAIEAKQKTYEAATKALSSYSNPKNPTTFLPPWKEHGKRFHDHKEKLWKIAWDAQKSLISWPSSANVPLDEIWNRAASFKDWVNEISKEPFSTDARRDYKEDLYIQQFQTLDAPYRRLRDLYPSLAEEYNKLDIALLVAPVEFKNGLSGFEAMMAPQQGSGGGGGASFGKNQMFGGARPPGDRGAGRQRGGQGAGKSLQDFFKEPPTIEELWLAQEDFWIKHELLLVVRRALDELAQFREVKIKPEQVKAGFLQHRRFRNNTCELDLLFENKGGRVYISSKSTIRNIDPTKRILMLHNPYTNNGIEFQLLQADGNFQQARKFDIKGEPLPYLQKAEFNFKDAQMGLLDNLDPTRSFQVEQLFDWSNAPIRRIDEMRIGAHSHRTFPIALKPNPAFKVEGQPQPNAPPDGGNQTGGKPGGPNLGSGGGGGAQMMMKRGGGVGGGQGEAGATEPNGLDRNRYLYVTEQCRHTPIGMVVVLEQEHIHDLLVMLSTSKLRFQITQVQLKHVRGVRSELEPDGQTDQGRNPPPGNPPRTGGMPQLQQNMLPGSDENLVELSIYGVAAIYDRFTEKPVAPATGSPKDPPKKGPAGGAPKDKTKDDPKNKPKDKTKDQPKEKANEKPKGPPAGPGK
jgi:hypothetical protein